MPDIERNNVGGPFAVLPSRSLSPLSPLPDKSDPTAEHIAIRFPRFLPSPDKEPKMWTVRIGGVHTFSFGRWRLKQRVAPFDAGKACHKSPRIQSNYSKAGDNSAPWHNG